MCKYDGMASYLMLTSVAVFFSHDQSDSKTP